MNDEDMDQSEGQDSSPSNTNEDEEDLIACIGKDMVIDNKQLVLGTVIAETMSSTIYEASYKNQPVAVKIIKESGGAPPLYVHSKKKEKFLREVRMHYLAQHDSVVTFIGASIKPRMQIVMELMRGGSLSKYCQDRKLDGLDQSVAIGFAIQISRAMEHLHGKGIVHRDLKLANVLLTKDEEKAKLADFGLARTVADNKIMTPNIGTSLYMAPEIRSILAEQKGAERKPYDHKVDVFSFSMVLWKLLKNGGPFEFKKGELAARALQIYKNNERPSVDNIPEGLVSLFVSSWAEESTSRPEFHEITTTLEEFLRRSQQ